MQNQFIQSGNPLNRLVGVLFVLGIFGAQPVQARGDGSFTNASLKGNYAYVNNVSDVASLGKIIFDGHGVLAAKILVNLPCTTPVSGCPRVITDIPKVDGTYTVKADGTGVATINFPTGVTTYSFIVSETAKEKGKRLATQVFAVGQSGGLAGQIIAPTWTRISD